MDGRVWDTRGGVVGYRCNPYFILEPGYQLVFEGGKERLTITVLDETKTIAGVETRVVDERETKDGKLTEVSRNFFAISKRTNSVFYFGEEVDIFKDGKVVGREGAWLAGEKGARFGLMMPGQVLLKARHYQEIAPKVAMDRAEIVSMSATVKTPAGEFKNCLKVEETTPLEPGTKEYKYYAPGIWPVAGRLPEARQIREDRKARELKVAALWCWRGVLLSEYGIA